MARSLSSLVDNLAERIHKIKLNIDMIIKNVKCMKLNTKIVSDILNTETSDLLKKYAFSNHNTNKFLYLLQKAV